MEEGVLMGNNKTKEFVLTVKNNKEFKFEGQNLIKRSVKSFDQDTITACVNFENDKCPGVAMSDIHVGYLISKLNCVNVSELQLACKLRNEKLKDIKLPTESELTDVLRRLSNSGIICSNILEGTMCFYFASVNGRKFLNRAMGSMNVKDLDFYEMKGAKELLGEAAVTYIALSLVKEGYELEQKRIIRINHSVERFPALLKKNERRVAIEKLYLIKDSTTTSDAEYVDYIERTIGKFCYYLNENPNDRLILACNDSNDIKIFFGFLANPKLASIYENVASRLYFTCVSQIKSQKILTDSFARFELSYNSNGGIALGNDCIFDFDL